MDHKKYLLFITCIMFRNGQNPFVGYIETIFLQSKAYNEAFNEAEWIFANEPNGFDSPEGTSVKQRIAMTKLSAKNEIYFRVCFSHKHFS